MASVPVAGQSAALFVHVSGDDGSIAGARIELLKGDAVHRRAITDSEGTARLVGLSADSYRLRIDAIGHRSTVQEITLGAGQSQEVRVRLESLPFELDPIEVRAARVEIERENTDFSTTVDEAALEMLPLTTDASQLAGLAPGARPGHVWGGASFQANSYRMDGLSVNHPGLGGALLEPSIHWIERVEVRGLGAGAEHGGFQGGQVHVVTKRGTNDFSAMLRTSTEHHALAATNLVLTEIGSEVDSRYDVEGDVGGAFVRDRLFYYVGGSFVDRTARFLNHLSHVEARYSPLVEERTELKSFGKLTWTPSSAAAWELSGGYFGTTADNYGMTGYEGPGAASSYESPTWFGNLAWRYALGDRATIEARVNHFARDERQEPYGGADQPGTRLFALTPPYTHFGNAPFTLRSAPSSSSASLAGAFRFRTGGQEHLVKLGGEFTRGRFVDRRARNGGMTWLPIQSASLDPEDPASWPGEDGYTPTQWGGEVDLAADVMNAAAYVQTALSLGRLVLSPGMRWGMWQGWSRPNDSARFKAVEDAAIDPRIGATLELTRDGSMVLKGHWGRYHQDMIARMFDRAAGSDVFTDEEIWYYTGPPVSDPGQGFTQDERAELAARGLFTRASVITLNETGPVVAYDQPYIDQWLIGFEKQFGSSVKIEALYARRSNRDMIALVDRNRATNYTRIEKVSVHPAQGEIPIPFEGIYTMMSEVYIPNNTLLDVLRSCASRPGCEPPPGFSFADTVGLTWNPDYVLTNAPDARREFHQLQLTVDVARPTWGGSFSLTTTELAGNLDNVAGYVDPGAFGPGPYVRINEGVNAYGKLPNFSDRELKVSAWAMLPWDLRGGIFWTYQSGDYYASQFRISALGLYDYRVGQIPVDRCCLLRFMPDGSPCSEPACLPDQWGDTIPEALFTPLEGHDVFIGPRGAHQLERRANIDVRLERAVTVGGFDLGLAIVLFNVFGKKHVTRVQTMANNGRNVDYLWPGTTDPYAWPPLGDGDDFFGAPLERVPPRSLRLGVTLYL